MRLPSPSSHARPREVALQASPLLLLRGFNVLSASHDSPRAFTTSPLLGIKQRGRRHGVRVGALPRPPPRSSQD